VSISAAVKDPGKPMPGITTLIHALLQIITVAMGSRSDEKLRHGKWGHSLQAASHVICVLPLPIFN
jgi:hypothetical protein